MKILHVINSLTSGGAEKLLTEILPLLNEKKDVKADLLILTDENNVFEEMLLASNVNIFYVKYNKRYDPRNILEINKLINTGSYDIVHAHLFPVQYWVSFSRLLLRNDRVKFITTEHSTHNNRRGKLYLKLIEKMIYSKYDLILSITEETKINLINWIDPNRKTLDKHVVIENGINIKKFKKALPYIKSELIEGISDNNKIICMVGRFNYAKDQPTLIRAISKLSNDVHLVLVGEGPLISVNRDLAKNLGITNRVHFLGFRRDIHRILKTVDIIVLSSHWEGFGLAAIEGMAANKPLLASKVDGLSETVKGAGLLFQSEDELINHIEKLIHDKDFYYKTSQACLYRAENYDIEKMMNKLIDKYQKVM